MKSGCCDLLPKKQQHFMTNIVFRGGSRKCTEKRANRVRVVSLVWSRPEKKEKAIKNHKEKKYDQ
jgi:hypothetical protein